jgi:hypothetical protein
MKRLCIYILASKPYGTLYVGVTSDLSQRMAQHSQGLIEGFAKKKMRSGYGYPLLPVTRRGVGSEPVTSASLRAFCIWG